MPTTNRPFLSNFLAAFRAHSAIQSQASSKPTSSPTNTTHNPSPSAPRTISTAATSKTGATTTALTSLHSPRAHSTSPGPESLSPNTTQSRYMTSSRTRRGSDSSSEGFRDVLGAEKWYIGGRTAGGEERYFKLGVVKRQRSGGDLSLDRLSL